MGRFRVILCLLLLAAFFHYFTEVSQWVTLLLKNTLPTQRTASSQQAALPNPLRSLETSDIPKEWGNQVQEFAQKIADFSESFNRPAPPPPAPKHPAKPLPPPPTPEDPTFLQVIMEDMRKPLQNDTLGPEISALLDNFLQNKRAYNAQLANETEELFGPEAKKEVVRILIDDEIDSAANAETCASTQDFATRQEEINARTEQKLYEAFSRHKQDINRQAARVSPAWKAFFKRLDNYRRSADIAAKAKK